MFTTPARICGTSRRIVRDSGGTMTVQSVYAAANEPNTLAWYADQLLAFPALAPSSAASITAAMAEGGYEQHAGRWVKVPQPRPTPESQPPVPALPAPRRATARSAA